MLPILLPLAARVNTLLSRLTSGRAAALDNLDAAISSISPVRSIQSGTIALGTSSSNTATISAVTTGKSVVLFGGVDGGSGSTPADWGITLTLTNSTTVTANRNGTGNGCHVRYTVLEYN